MIKKLYNIFNKKENLIGMSYETNFHKAISRTRRLGLDLPKIDFSEERYLTEDYCQVQIKNAPICSAKVHHLVTPIYKI